MSHVDKYEFTVAEACASLAPCLTEDTLGERLSCTKLYKWQFECLNETGVLNGESLVYRCPTGSGKTLIAELAILLCTTRVPARKAIIVLPYVSLVEEKLTSMKRCFASFNRKRPEFQKIRVSALYGFQNVNKRTILKNNVIICTIEKANAVFDVFANSSNYQDLGVVVIDEVHLIGESTRGALLEAFISKLIYLSQVKSFIQVISMSATLGNIDSLAGWMQARKYTTQFRPVVLTTHLVCGEVDVHGIEAANELVHLVKDARGSGRQCLVFCRTKNICSTVCRYLSSECVAQGEDNQSYNESTNSWLLSLERLKDGSLNARQPEAVLRGFAFHHAGLTTEERKSVELAFRQGVVTTLACTSTLAAGINLPASVVIVIGVRVANERIGIEKYVQMIGRAGRPGLDTKADAYLLVNSKNKQEASTIMGARLPVETSQLNPGKDGGGNIAKLLLCAFVANIIHSLRDVVAFVQSTFLFFESSEEARRKVFASVQSALEYLIYISALETDSSSFDLVKLAKLPLKELRLNHHENDCDYYFRYSRFGKAVVDSHFSLAEATILYKSLLNCQKSLNIGSRMHMLYLIAPVKETTLEPDWDILHDCFFYTDGKHIKSSSAKEMLQLSSILRCEGVSSQEIVRWRREADTKEKRRRYFKIAARFTAPTLHGDSDSLRNAAALSANQWHQLGVAIRAYTALVLYRTTDGVPINVLAEKLEVSQEVISELINAAQISARRVQRFCSNIGWKQLEKAVSAVIPTLYVQSSRVDDLRHLFESKLLDMQAIHCLNSHGILNCQDLIDAPVTLLANSLVPLMKIKQKSSTCEENAGRNTGPWVEQESINSFLDTIIKMQANVQKVNVMKENKGLGDGSLDDHGKVDDHEDSVDGTDNYSSDGSGMHDADETSIVAADISENDTSASSHGWRSMHNILINYYGVWNFRKGELLESLSTLSDLLRVREDTKPTWKQRQRIIDNISEFNTGNVYIPDSVSSSCGAHSSFLRCRNEEGFTMRHLRSAIHWDTFQKELMSDKSRCVSIQLCFRRIPSEFLSARKILGEMHWSDFVSPTSYDCDPNTKAYLDADLSAKIGTSFSSIKKNPIAVSGVALCFGSSSAYFLPLPTPLPPLQKLSEVRTASNIPLLSPSIMERICIYCGGFELWVGGPPSYACPQNPLLLVSRIWAQSARNALISLWRSKGSVPWDIIENLLINENITIVGFNLQSQLTVLLGLGISSVAGPLEDPVVASRLLMVPLTNTKVPLSETSESSVHIARKASYRAINALRCMASYEPLLRSAGMLPFFRNIQMPYVGSLAEIQSRGMNIEKNFYTQLVNEISDRQKLIEAYFFNLEGPIFNPLSTSDVAFMREKIARRGCTNIFNHPLVELCSEYNDLERILHCCKAILKDTFRNRLWFRSKCVNSTPNGANCGWYSSLFNNEAATGISFKPCEHPSLAEELQKYASAHSGVHSVNAFNNFLGERNNSQISAHEVYFTEDRRRSPSFPSIYRGAYRACKRGYLHEIITDCDRKIAILTGSSEQKHSLPVTQVWRLKSPRVAQKGEIECLNNFEAAIKNNKVRTVYVHLRDGIHLQDHCVYLFAQYEYGELQILAQLTNCQILREAIMDTDPLLYLASKWMNVPRDSISSNVAIAVACLLATFVRCMEPDEISKELDLPTELVQNLLDDFRSKHSRLDRFFRFAIDSCRSNGGLAYSLLNRSLNIEGINSRKINRRKSAEAKAIHFIVQGSLDDVLSLVLHRIQSTLKSMPDLQHTQLPSLVPGLGDKGYRRPVEVLFQADNGYFFRVHKGFLDTAEKTITNIMSRPLEFPLRVAIKTGSCWSELQ